MTDSLRRSGDLWLEWGVWTALAAAGYWLSYDFDEPLDVYAFGAAGWPRFLLVCIFVGASVQLVLRLVQRRRLAAPEAAADTYWRALARERWELVNRRLAGIFGLPLVYLFLVPRAGFFVATPVFVLAFLWVLDVRRARPLLGVTAAVYAMVLLVFTRLFYVALPVGNWPVFYDVNTWIVVTVRTPLFGG